jgi:hypothetical protein
MELRSDVAHVESRSVCSMTVLVSVQDRCTVCARWYSKLTRIKWKHVLVYLDIVLIWTQDRCTVCAERTIGLEIILNAPDGTPRRCGSFQMSFL